MRVYKWHLQNLGIALLWVSSFVSYFDAMTKAYVEGRAEVSLSYALIFFIAAAVLIALRHRRSPQAEGASEEFQPIGKFDRDKAWDRPTETNEILQAIEHIDQTVIVLVGASGTGKSKLVEQFVQPSLDPRNWKVINVPGAPIMAMPFKAAIRRHLPPNQATALLSDSSQLPASLDKNTLVIFDQFERYPTAPENLDSHAIREIESFSTSLKRALKFQSLTLLFIVRKEAYYDLTQYFVTYDISISRTIKIGGLRKELDPDAWNALTTSFNKILKTRVENEETIHEWFSETFPSNEILPVEAQIIGWTLEASVIPRMLEAGRIELPSLTKTYILHAYIRQQLDAYASKAMSFETVDGAIALRVLLALSFQRPTGRNLSDTEISEIVHQRVGEVQDCLNFYQEPKRGLIQKVENNKYELAHDYLATVIREFSATEMHPLERDNISYFSDLVRDEAKQFRCPWTNVNRSTRLTMSDVLFTVVGAWLVVRLFSPTLDFGIGWVERISADPRMEYYSVRLNEVTGWSSLIDVYFLPLFVSSVMGLSYAHALHNNFFVYLKNEGIWGLLSISVIIVAYICVVVMTIYSHYWWALLLVPVMLYSVKLFQIGVSRGLPATVRTEFWRVGVIAGISSLFLFLVGASLGVYTENTEMEDALIEKMHFGDWLIMCLMFFYYAVGYQGNVSKRAAIRFLGLMDRGKRDRYDQSNPSSTVSEGGRV